MAPAVDQRLAHRGGLQNKKSWAIFFFFFFPSYANLAF
jgi:hypothetical protein